MAMPPINPTQAMGLFAFFLTAALAALAARTHRGRNRWVWAVLAMTYALFLLEVSIGMRHAMHDIVNARLLRAGYYADRLALQGALALVLVASLVGAAASMRQAPLSNWLAGARARTAAVGTLGVALLFALELISLHQIDAVLYANAGPVAVIGWLWAAAAAITSTSACFTLRRQRGQHNSAHTR